MKLEKILKVVLFLDFITNTLISYKLRIDNRKKITITIFLWVQLAQLVEQFPFKEWVVGSNPTRLTIYTIGG